MEISICRICLQSDEVDEEMRSIFEGNESKPTLQSKLNALGFLQAREEDGLPSLLCGWCAARVDDAFDLKLQCERSRENLKNMHDNVLSVQKEEIVAEDIGLAVLDLSFKTSNYFVEHFSSASSDTNNRNISSMLSCTRKMMTCLGNFSSALRKLGWVVNNSLKFTMEIVSLFCSDGTIEFQKVLHLEREADNWKTKSAMIEETVGFLHLLTSASETSTLTASSGVGVHEWSAHSETSISSDSSGFMELSSDTSFSAQSFSSNHDLNNNCKEKTSEVSYVQQSKSQHKPLRRSKRSKKSNNHSLVCSQCPNDASGPSDLTMSTLLLDLSPEGSSHYVNAHNNSLVCPNKDSQEKGKRKESHCGDAKLRKKKKKKSKTSNGSESFPSTVLNPIYAENIQCTVASNNMEKDCKRISPSISVPLEWGKDTESNIPMLNHVKTTSTTTLYPCSFCEKNFSTGWNRTQHERCHTGQKPYVCNVCGESFRYNVTMRNHRARIHNIKSEV